MTTLAFMTLAQCASYLAPWIALGSFLVVVLYLVYGVQAALAMRTNGVLSIRSMRATNRFLAAKVAVFVFCSLVGYFAVTLSLWFAWAYWLKAIGLVVLIPSSAAMVWLQYRHDFLGRILDADARAEAAEDATDIQGALMEAAFSYIHSAIYQICEFVQDSEGPLQGPDGEMYDMRVVAATPGMRDYFHIPGEASVRGRSHYEVYPGIFDPTTGRRGRADWLAGHATALAGEPVYAGDQGDTFRAPGGAHREFSWALHPLLVEDGMARGVLMEIVDRTESARLIRERDEARARANRYQQYVKVDFEQLVQQQ